MICYWLVLKIWLVLEDEHFFFPDQLEISQVLIDQLIVRTIKISQVLIDQIYAER
jgi:hypothetical protein